MGLDNIPASYPCKLRGSAVMEDDKIDCRATQDAGGCPWKAARLGDGAIYGLFGTDCWYRGKAGTWMLQTLAEAGAELPGAVADGFYGVEDTLSPEYCRTLADWMADHGELFLSATPADEREEAGREYRYAVGWLRWVAEHCEGARAWW